MAPPRHAAILAEVLSMTREVSRLRRVAVAAFVDACVADRCAAFTAMGEGVIGWLEGGPSLAP